MKKLVFASFALTGLLLVSCGEKKTEVVLEEPVVVDTVNTVIDTTVVDAPVVDTVVVEETVTEVVPAAPVEAQ